MHKLRRILHWGPITALVIISLLFVSSILADLAWFPPTDLKGIIHLSAFCTWVFLILKNFFKAVYIGPGYLPDHWKPDNNEDTDKLQYCSSCQGYKAPRVHHCRQCKRCIMKMDHHCPWINNCVGHKNHKSFSLFLFFVVIGCSHAAVINICCTLEHLTWMNGYFIVKVYEDELITFSSLYLLLFCFGIGLSIGVTVAVGLLLYYQVKAIVRNETGVESWIVEKADRIREEDEVFIYPYNLGIWNNVKQVITWSGDYVGDGITWPVRKGCHQYTLTIEQLEQKKLKRERMVLHKLVSSYNGAWVTCRYGIRVCCDSPCSDDPRMPVKDGDSVYVTRWRRRWLYGEKVKPRNKSNGVSSSGSTEREKGWFPRQCAVEVIDADVDDFVKKNQ